ncbi:hypothetical protein [Mucilaginibacter sp. UYNi724]
MKAKATKKDTKILNIVSLDEKPQKIKIVPDYVNHVLRITCMKVAINILDYWGVPPEIHVLNKNFIEISYAVRGGSNSGLWKTLILCVNGEKLYEAMHVLKYVNVETGDLMNDYHIKLSLRGDIKNNYKLKINIHDDVRSKPKPETNYIYNNRTILNFDTRQNVFYSVKKDINDHSIKRAIGMKQKVNGNFPMIILGKENYYFIDNKWFQLTDTKEFSEI